MRFAMGLFALFLSAQIASACEPILPRYKIDGRVKVKKDCSFSGAGFKHTDHWGGAGVDIGGARVAQSTAYSGVCIINPSEGLRVIDCQSLQIIEISGQPSAEFAKKWKADGFQPDAVYNAPQLVDKLFPPVGSNTLTPTTTIEELAQISKNAGYSFSTDIVSNIGKMSKRNRYDPFCACRIFYPNSNASKIEAKG